MCRVDEDLWRLVYQDLLDDKWYFWDETMASRVGPYQTKEEAKEALEKYANAL